MKKNKKNDGLTKALIFVAVFLVLFIISIEIMYYIVGTIPDALVVGVLGCGGGECITCAFLYFIKKKWGPWDE